MIAGIFHSGSGIGNQLHRYVATRVLALDKGYDFSMVAPEFCKVKDFMNLDMGKQPSFAYHVKMPEGKVVTGLPFWEEKTNYYNPEFNFIEDSAIIDGEFQDQRYFEHRMKEVNEWLKVEPIDVPDNVCVIGFRGGEFSVFPDLYLTDDYWRQAMLEMISVNPGMSFQVHTDDVIEAKKFFPDLECIHNPGINWRSVRYAKYSIIPNSSFYILPRLLAHDTTPGAVTIAPRYWARRNTKEWSMPQNYYKQFKYI